ncbi:MAG: Fic family protein [Bdellovibrio sp.]|nr:Fic family protein [Bdellovibrio sp.]
MKQLPLPPLLFPAKTSADRAWMTQLKKKGLIYSIGPRLYASVERSQISNIARSQWSNIISNLFQKALLSHRSALEYRPSPKGEIILTSNTNRKIVYPGLTLKFIRGPTALEDDLQFLNLKASSLPRALLENLSRSQARGTSKVLPLEEIEKRLEQILHLKGEKTLNTLRDRASEISKKFEWKREFKKLNEIIGALLGTKRSKKIKSTQSIARATGYPYDTQCFERLEILFGELRHYPLPEIKDQFTGKNHFVNKAFFEAYFSNYIEGTVFEIEEAEDIIFNKKIPPERPKDAHDILGTFSIVSDPNEMKITPKHFEDFETLLKKRHVILIKARTETLPGKFKLKPNRAGNTHFVHPDYVVGTLKKGFDFYHSLPLGLARAQFMQFLITDIHPFTDGNGRMARIMMNAELHAQGLSTLIIPTVYREDYLLAQRALSRRNRATPSIEMLIKAQKFSQLDFSHYPKILKYLKKHNWFEEPEEAKLLI